MESDPVELARSGELDKLKELIKNGVQINFGILYLNSAVKMQWNVADYFRPYIGKVYIASMNMRGTRAPKPENTISLNVTSMQSTSSQARIDFSPMTPIEGGYKGFWNFEGYWQAGKVYEGLDNTKHIQWWKNQHEAKRRYPPGKGVRVMYSIYPPGAEGPKRDYITSRKEVYVPEYFELMKDTKIFKEHLAKVVSGNSVVIYDFDGPRDISGEPICLEVSRELLIDKINDPKFPFGHGYIVAGALLGFYPAHYV